MGKTIVMTGQKFGRLTVLGIDTASKTIKNKEKIWVCQCECGNKVSVRGYNLRSGNTKSCGCLNKEIVAKRSKESPWKKHGLSSDRIYKIYHAMKARCYNKNLWNYDKYGGRGILICKEWLDDFMNFYNWAMANGYDDTKSIDRIDVDGNYCPENCRWADNTTQQFNRGKQSNNKTGYVGVSKVKSGHYKAYIKKHNKQICLGTFPTIEQAVEARKKAEKEYY